MTTRRLPRPHLRHSLPAAALCALLVAGCAAAPRPSGTAGGARPAAAQPPSPPPGAPVERAAIFAFYSDPWVNLHHFLYNWARAASGKKFGREPDVEVPERAAPLDLSPAESAAWQAAVDLYSRDLMKRDLLFDEELVSWDERLTRAEATGGASLDELPADLHRVLAAAMPIYRWRWWPRHDEANRRWIAATAAELRTEPGAAALAALAPAYGGKLPPAEVRADICAYSNWAGAYTTELPRLTISSTDPGNQPPAGLEVMLHEVSHAGSLEQPLFAALSAAFARRGAKPPENLWHAFIFFTAGELTRAALGSRVPGYVPMAEQGLYERARWTAYKTALDRHWKGYLEGRTDREAALDGVAGELSVGAGSR